MSTSETGDIQQPVVKQTDFSEIQLQPTENAKLKSEMGIQRKDPNTCYVTKPQKKQPSTPRKESITKKMTPRRDNEGPGSHNKFDNTKVQRRQSRSLPILVVPDNELTEVQMNEIIASFELIDANKDGRISKLELIKAATLIGMNPTEEDATSMMRLADLDGDGFISFQEYKNMMREQYISVDIETERMLAAFKVLDRNNDGYITRDELKYALRYRQPAADEDEMDKFIELADLNKDGKIDYTEFVHSKLCSNLFQHFK